MITPWSCKVIPLYNRVRNEKYHYTFHFFVLGVLEYCLTPNLLQRKSSPIAQSLVALLI